MDSKRKFTFRKGVFISKEDVKSYKIVEDFVHALSYCNINSVFMEAEEYSLKLIKSLHNHGIQFFASFSVFANSTILQKHPELAPINAAGKEMEAIEGYVGLCPTNKSYRMKKLEDLSKLVERYGMDGVWLDFIRYPTKWEEPKPILRQYCFCQSCLQKFSEDTGILLPGEGTRDKAEFILSKHTEAWVNWKCEVIEDFVAQTKKRIAEVKLGIPLGAFTVPWKKDDLGGAIKSIVGQDFKLLSKWVDIFSPMTYHRLCEKSVEWVGEITEHMVELTNSRVWTTIQSYNVPTREFKGVLDQVVKSGSSGVVVFHWNGVKQDRERMEILRNFFKKL